MFTYHTHSPSRDYSKIQGDMGAALDYNFLPSQFAARGGYFFPAVIDHPEQYLRKTTDRVKTWLADLRSSGSRTFLLTNSHTDYTDHLMHYAYGQDWMQAFDVVIVNSRKPLFFTASKEDSPFYDVVHAQGKADTPTSLHTIQHSDSAPASESNKALLQDQSNIYKLIFRFFCECIENQRPSIYRTPRNQRQRGRDHSEAEFHSTAWQQRGADRLP